ncbi:MAG: ORF6N domain-containing protein [Candidatus Omnitrophica bacterium]|nr:ORF6N domain-containing protein [Candidatus Omnitrophota bacterium]
MSDLISIEAVTSKIFVIRKKKVMLDRDLAFLYEVTTKRLNEQVKRNRKRFPVDFMFQLTKTEKDELVAICDRFNTMKHSTVLPYAFTEQGVAMLSGVLNSDRAIMVNIQIMRAFTQLRRMILANKELFKKIKEIERKYDSQFKIVFDAIRQLMTSLLPKQDRVIKGFHP